MQIPPVEPVARLVTALERAGQRPALGGSGLLVALGLADAANDWDVTVDAPVSAVTEALDAGGFGYRDETLTTGVYATGLRLVVAVDGHDIDLLVNFALRGPHGVEPLPARVTGRWRGLPVGDPVVWERAYRLLGRGAKAALLERWLTERE